MTGHECVDCATLPATQQPRTPRPRRPACETTGGAVCPNGTNTHPGG